MLSKLISYSPFAGISNLVSDIGGLFGRNTAPSEPVPQEYSGTILPYNPDVRTRNGFINNYRPIDVISPNIKPSLMIPSAFEPRDKEDNGILEEEYEEIPDKKIKRPKKVILAKHKGK